MTIRQLITEILNFFKNTNEYVFLSSNTSDELKIGLSLGQRPTVIFLSTALREINI